MRRLCRAATSLRESMASARVILVADLDDGVRGQQRLRARAPDPPGRASRARWLPQVRNAGSVFLGALDAGDHGRLLQRHQPRAADLRLRARATAACRCSTSSSASPCRSSAPTACARSGPTAITLAGSKGSTRTRNAVQCPAASARSGVRCMNTILALARPDILALQPYQHAAGTRRSSACTPTRCPGARRATTRDAGLNRYPEPQPRALRRAPGRALRRAGRADARRPRQRRGHRPAGARVLPRRAGQRRHLPADLRLCTRSPRASRARRCARCRCCGRDFALDADGVLAGVDATPSSCSCARRTIPTGNAARRGAILEHLPRARSERRSSWSTRPTSSSPRVRASLSRLAEFPNLVVLRTLSKAYALAGARCGALLAIRGDRRSAAGASPPYALPALDRRGRASRSPLSRSARQAQARIDTLRGERERMRARLVAAAWRAQGLPARRQFPAGRVRDAAGARSPPAARAGLLIRDLRAHPRLAALPAHHGRHARTERAAARRAGALHERRSACCSSTATAR